jgi:hypothetical protein
MARIRTIKPDFFTSEDIVLLSPLARLFYIALWCEADKEGRFAWKPKTFKLRYFPGDNCDIDALADELLNARLVMLYEGATLAYIPSFGKHQHINPRESASVLPDPNTAPKRTRAPRVADASPREEDAQVGREGKGSINPLPLSGGGATVEPPADPPAKVHEFPPGFDRFWQAYPRKTAKPQAAKAFARLRPDEPLLLRMLAALALQRQSAQWQRDDGQFIPHPSTWLNGRRWEDEGAAQTADAFAGAV